MRTIKETVEALVKAGANPLINVKVRTVNVRQNESATFVRLYLDNVECLGYRENELGVLEQVKDAHHIDVTFYDLLRIVDENPVLAGLHSSIERKPQSLEGYLAGATITAYQIDQEGTTVTNWFTEEQYTRVSDKGVTNYVTSINLSDNGSRLANIASLSAIGAIDFGAMFGITTQSQPSRKVRRSIDEDTDE